MTNKQTLKIAAQLLNEVAARSTDATAFKVDTTTVANRIYLVPDTERRNKAGDYYRANAVFFHMEEVVDICRALHLSCWIGAEEDDKGNPTFEVDIY